MTIEDARALAESEIALAQQMGASHEHPESGKRARLASVILDLCSQLDAEHAAAASAVVTKTDATGPVKKKPRTRKASKRSKKR